MRVALVGGTGDFGLAVARRLVEAGDEVLIGSRDADRAAEKATPIGAKGRTNEDAAGDAELVVLAVNAEAAVETARALATAIGATATLSVASELHFSKAGVRPRDGISLAEEIAELLDAPVVAGLHSLAAASLASGPAYGDALVCGDDETAKALALELAGKLVTGRAFDAGPLVSARALEGMTAVIVNLNRRYRGHAGLHVTGLP